MSAVGVSSYRRTRGSVSSAAGSAGATVALLIYTNLWVIEGALRKWLPATDRPMYVARDAIAIVALILLLLLGARGPRYITLITVVGVIALAVGVLVSAAANFTPAPIAFVGLRSYIAPGIAIVIATMAPRSAGRSMARVIALWAPVNAFLAVVQSTSGAGAWINRQASGAEAAFEQFGAVRASGTFTAPAGLTTYVVIALAASLVLLLVSERPHDRAIGAWGLGSSVIVVTVGGSRGAVLSAAVIAIFVLWSVLVTRGHVRPRNVVRIAAIAAVAFFAARALFPHVFEAFVERFSNAALSEDSSSRLFAQLTGFVGSFGPFFGDGPGVHSQAGIALGSGASWIENDSTKYVTELGAMGMVLAIVRLAIVVGCIAIPFVRPTRWPLDVSILTVALGAQQLTGQVTQTPTAQAAFAIGVAMVFLATRPRQAAEAPGDGDPPLADTTPEDGNYGMRVVAVPR